MVEFSKKLKPIFIDNSELVRLGSIDDGGYVVPKVQHTNIGPVTQDKYKNLYTDDIHDMIKEYFWYEIKEFNYSF